MTDCQMARRLRQQKSGQRGTDGTVRAIENGFGMGASAGNWSVFVLSSPF